MGPEKAALGRAQVLLLCGFLALTLSFGIRASFGLYLPEMNRDLGWSLSTLSYLLAIQNLLWGATQPLAGALSDLRGAAVTLLLGVLIYAAGLILMATSQDLFFFGLGSGVMIGFGLSALGFPVILGAIGRTTPQSHRSLYLGIATAGGSFGQVLVAPISQVALEAIGWVNTLLVLAGVCGLSAFLALGLRLEIRNPAPSAAVGGELRFGETLHLALRHRGFLLLITGFFVCGFQLAFISFHLPAFAAFCGLPARAGALGIALIGLFNILGSIGAGKLGSVWRPKFPLSAIYALRALAIALFLIVPVSEASLYLFSAAMGLLWLSTIPLTSGVIGQIFGPRFVGTLFGIAFFSHQLGSFAGLWLTGLFLDLFGTYDAIWWTAAALGLFAAAVHLPIDDRPVGARAPHPSAAA